MNKAVIIPAVKKNVAFYDDLIKKMAGQSLIERAINKAKEIGAFTISLTGHLSGKLGSISDLSICIPSDDTPRIQESHILIGHIICQLIEEGMFPK